jgi:beta-mannosidase
VVALQDGTRPFKPGSPSIGEHHNWRVWHWQANTRDYRQDEAGFMAEFGLQAPPSIASLKKFIPADQLWPPGDMWTYHNAELVKLWRYARGVDPDAKTLEEFVAASQTAQLRGLQVMIEHARRSKGRTSGCAFWQLNEPWPAICWSVIDYYRNPKPAYAKIRELYNPILVSFYYPLQPHSAGERVPGELWLINDTLGAAGGELRVTLNGERILATAVEIGPNSAAPVGGLEVELQKGTNALRLELVNAGGIVSTNEYDLNYFDRGEMVRALSPLQALAARLQS